MDVFVTYVLGVDFTPPILLSTYYRVKAAAESMRVWERCPLLLARGTCASSEERKGSKLDINHPECQPAEPKSLGKARLFSSSFPKSRGSDPNSDSEQRLQQASGMQETGQDLFPTNLGDLVSELALF